MLIRIQNHRVLPVWTMAPTEIKIYFLVTILTTTLWCMGCEMKTQTCALFDDCVLQQLYVDGCTCFQVNPDDDGNNTIRALCRHQDTNGTSINITCNCVAISSTSCGNETTVVTNCQYGPNCTSINRTYNCDVNCSTTNPSNLTNSTNGTGMADSPNCTSINQTNNLEFNCSATNSSNSTNFTNGTGMADNIHVIVGAWTVGVAIIWIMGLSIFAAFYIKKRRTKRKRLPDQEELDNQSTCSSSHKRWSERFGEIEDNPRYISSTDEEISRIRERLESERFHAENEQSAEILLENNEADVYSFCKLDKEDICTQDIDETSDTDKLHTTAIFAKGDADDARLSSHAAAISNVYTFCKFNESEPDTFDTSELTCVIRNNNDHVLDNDVDVTDFAANAPLYNDVDVTDFAVNDTIANDVDATDFAARESVSCNIAGDGIPNDADDSGDIASNNEEISNNTCIVQCIDERANEASKRRSDYEQVDNDADVVYYVLEKVDNTAIPIGNCTVSDDKQCVSLETSHLFKQHLEPLKTPQNELTENTKKMLYKETPTLSLKTSYIKNAADQLKSPYTESAEKSLSAPLRQTSKESVDKSFSKGQDGDYDVYNTLNEDLTSVPSTNAYDSFANVRKLITKDDACLQSCDSKSDDEYDVVGEYLSKKVDTDYGYVSNHGLSMPVRPSIKTHAVDEKKSPSNYGNFSSSLNMVEPMLRCGGNELHLENVTEADYAESSMAISSIESTSESLYEDIDSFEAVNTIQNKPTNNNSAAKISERVATETSVTATQDNRDSKRKKSHERKQNDNQEFSLDSRDDKKKKSNMHKQTDNQEFSLGSRDDKMKKSDVRKQTDNQEFSLGSRDDKKKTSDKGKQTDNQEFSLCSRDDKKKTSDKGKQTDNQEFSLGSRDDKKKKSDKGKQTDNQEFSLGSRDDKKKTSDKGKQTDNQEFSLVSRDGKKKKSDVRKQYDYEEFQLPFL